MKTTIIAVIALALASSAADAQYTAYRYGQSSTILMPNGGGTSGIGNTAPQQPTIFIPNARLVPSQPAIATPQNWQQFCPGRC